MGFSHILEPERLRNLNTYKLQKVTEPVIIPLNLGLRLKVRILDILTEALEALVEHLPLPRFVLVSARTCSFVDNTLSHQDPVECNRSERNAVFLKKVFRSVERRSVCAGVDA